MKCTACGSENTSLIKVFSGSNQLGWSPVGAEKDIFGNYKKLRPLLAHACNDCGNVIWSIKVDKPNDPTETVQALDDLARAEADFDPGEESSAYMFGDELN